MEGKKMRILILMAKKSNKKVLKEIRRIKRVRNQYLQPMKISLIYSKMVSMKKISPLNLFQKWLIQKKAITRDHLIKDRVVMERKVSANQKDPSVAEQVN
jgi:predicted HTH domain antitoxin